MEPQAATEVFNIIRPQNELENEILSHPSFVEGAMWGVPRPGHPEGTVIHHIRDVLDNISAYCLGHGHFYTKWIDLRLIAILHDTFKYKVDRTQPRIGENHHGLIARIFAENYEISEGILDIIELHDEAYNAWQKATRRGKPAGGVQRAMKLIDRLGNNLDLYMDFYRCDNSTGNKSNEPYEWFLKIVQQNKSRSCATCHYSKRGETSCFRHMDYADPKIDLTKGPECVGCNNEYVHYLPSI